MPKARVPTAAVSRRADAGLEVGPGLTHDALGLPNGNPVERVKQRWFLAGAFYGLVDVHITAHPTGLTSGP